MTGRDKQTKDSKMTILSGKAGKVPTRTISLYTPDHKRGNKLPLFLEAVSAGFPSPAEDYLEGQMDLNEHLVKHPAATFFVRVSGDSMLEVGIRTGDLLVVDRAIQPADGQVAIAILNGELTVKRIRSERGKLLLIPENKAFKPIPVDPEASFEIWGVVTHVIHSL